MPGITSPRWPLSTSPKSWTMGGSFGAPRPSKSNHTRNHEGVDLAADEGDPVYAMEDGTIVASQGWSGDGTRAIFVETPDHVLVYGAVKPGSFAGIGTPVKRGDIIALVGRYPGGSTMLHVEQWAKGTRPPRPKWPVDAPKPSTLYDVRDYLERAMQAPSKGQQAPAKKSTGSSGGGLVIAGVVIVGALFLMKGR